MRPQTKRFTVEKRKSRKARTEDQADLGFVRVKPERSEAVTRSPSFAAADRAFERMADAAHSRGSVAVLTASNEPGSNGAVERTIAANRILPDLSWRDHSQAGKNDEASMALKPRPPRQRKQSRGRKTQRVPRSGSRRPVTPEASLVDSVAERMREAGPREPSMVARDGGSITEPGAEGAVSLRRRSRLSPREIRRAVARGAINITVSSARSGKRR